MINKFLYGKPLVTPYNPKMDFETDGVIQELLGQMFWTDEEEMKEAKEFIEIFYDITEEDGEIKIKNKEI